MAKAFCEWLNENGMTENEVALIKEAGFCDADAVNVMSPKDLAECIEGLNIGRCAALKGKASRFLNEGKTTAPAASLPSSIVLKKDDDDKAAWELTLPQLFARFTSDGEDEDRRREAAEEWDSKAGGKPSVVVSDGNPNQDESLICLRHVRQTGSRLQFWGADDHSVVTAVSLLKITVLRDPIDGTVLSPAGENPKTLVSWEGVNPDRMALAYWAFHIGRYAKDISARNISAALRQESLNETWARIERRFKHDCEKDSGLMQRIKHQLTKAPNSITHDILVVGLDSGGPQQPMKQEDYMSNDFRKALRRLMAETLSVQEMRTVAIDAELNPARINMSGSGETVAFHVVQYAQSQGNAALTRLVGVMMNRVPGRFPLT